MRTRGMLDSAMLGCLLVAWGCGEATTPKDEGAPRADTAHPDPEPDPEPDPDPDPDPVDSGSPCGSITCLNGLVSVSTLRQGVPLLVDSVSWDGVAMRCSGTAPCADWDLDSPPVPDLATPVPVGITYQGKPIIVLVDPSEGTTTSGGECCPATFSGAWELEP